MIDLHCHILPGVDDGARDWKESLEMARLAVDEGITHILATPHHMNRQWINPKTEVFALVDELQSRIDQEDIPLTIFPGQEVRLHGEILENIQNDTICFIDELNQYVLVEFPTAEVPAYTERLFYELQSAGITPVVVHPERNHAILNNPNILYEFVQRDVLAQVTAASYLGYFGKKIEKLSVQLIEADLVHFVASDAHNVTNRKFYMKEAVEKLEKEFGVEKVEAFDQTSRDLVNGDVVVIPEAKKVEKNKRFFGLF
ncbi:MAG TPA: CpsB/CapC family capsule biosynthesis tyrosine phosphatase [Atopostipes sp.]|nr:CpsB/CapC family capsule biosynthesis tyrosine phosphatase [Atopostipes sp.]